MPADNNISGVNQVFHLTQSVFSLAVFEDCSRLSKTFLSIICTKIIAISSQSTILLIALYQSNLYCNIKAVTTRCYKI